MIKTNFIVAAALFLLQASACDDPDSIRDDEESNEVVQIEDSAVDPASTPSTQQITANVNPSANKKNCCFKCYQAGPWYNIKLNSGCNQYALGWCAGKHHAGVKEAEWSNKCPLW